MFISFLPLNVFSFRFISFLFLNVPVRQSLVNNNHFSNRLKGIRFSCLTWLPANFCQKQNKNYTIGANDVWGDMVQKIFFLPTKTEHPTSFITIIRIRTVKFRILFPVPYFLSLDPIFLVGDVDFEWEYYENGYF